MPTLRIERRLVSLLLALALLAGGAALWALRRHRGRHPEAAALKTARRYLGALRGGNIDGAYALLSSASRARCPISEFERAVPDAPWDFADLDVALFDGDAAFLRYVLRTRDRPDEDAYLLFVREGRRWVRPFTGNLFNKIEDAFDRGAAEEAHSHAKAAAAVDPRDPMARGYLCEAAYAKGLAEEAGRECAAALDLSRKHPSILTQRSLYHLHAILADVLKNALRRYPEAAEQYTALLGTPKLGSGDRCDLLLARAETRVAQRDHADAVRDFRDAVNACAGAEDSAYPRRAARVLDGSALAEAVSLVQGHSQVEGGQTWLDWRRQAHAELVRSLRARGYQGPPPVERWSAEHLGGARYRVRLQADDIPILSAQVDLWSNSVEQVQTQNP